MKNCFGKPINNPCDSYPDAKCIVYTAPTLSHIGVNTNDRLDAILKKINNSITSGGGSSITVQSSNSIHLGLTSGNITADLRVSNQSGNIATVLSGGLFVPNSNPIYITASDFSTTDSYTDSSLQNKDFSIYYRGIGFLAYDANNQIYPYSEYIILPSGGFQIIIPGFSVAPEDKFWLIPIN